MSNSKDRNLQARIAAHALHAKYDSREVTAAARRAFLARFERDADPDGLLEPVERARRAAHLRQMRMLQLARKSAEVRAARKGAS